jgi:hypothetical protein
MTRPYPLLTYAWPLAVWIIAFALIFIAEKDRDS